MRNVVSGHAPGHLREPVLELVDELLSFNTMPKRTEECLDKWTKSVGGADRARRLLGRLWNCTDQLDGFAVMELTEGLGSERPLYSVGCLARYVRPMIE